jgi:TldD protein
MLLIGLTGSIGSGKSLAAKYFAELGCRVVDADQLSRRLTEAGGKGLPAIVKAFGGGFLDATGGLDRKAMREFVFDRPAAKKKLEAILHPLIIAARAEMIAGLEAEEARSGEEIILVSEAALSIEAGLTGDFDHLLLITAPEALRRERVAARDPHGAAMFDTANATQMAEAEKARHADICLENSGDEASLRDGVAVVLEEMKRRGPLLKQYQAAQLLAKLTRGFAPDEKNGTAEIFWEKRLIARRYYEDSRLQELQTGSETGAALRIVRSGVTQYRALGVGDFQSLAAAAEEFAKAGAVAASPLVLKYLPRPHAEESFRRTDELSTRVSEELAADQRARAAGKERLRQFSLAVGQVEQLVVIASAAVTEGKITATYCREFRPRHVASVEAVAERNGKSSQAIRIHGVTGITGALRGEALLAQAETAAKSAVKRLDARALPPGRWPVLLAAGAGGTIFHEAVGHPLEADLAAGGATFFSAALQDHKPVAGAGIIVVDDGIAPGGFGSSAFDDEGIPARVVTLIREGLLAGQLVSRAEATADNPVTGNGRRETFRELPQPRMRNTYLRPGKADPAMLLAKMKKGVLVTQLGGGEVDTASGNFMFSATEAFWVENGERKHPLKGFTLAGNALAFLKKIKSIGNDFGTAAGICEKDGQDAPVSDGMPTILVEGLTLSH